MKVQTWLMDIPPKECASLLADARMGRLGVVVKGRPEIFPVNHVYDLESGRVTFATNDRTKLHAAKEWPWVSYEIDGVTRAPGGDEGWSVLVVGHVEEITDTDHIARLEEARSVLWHPGRGVRWMAIVPEKITGRRISATATGDDA